MSDEIMVRAITIGASILIIIIVFSAIMVYYSHAQEIAGLTEFETEKFYSKEIEAAISAVNSNGSITGTEVKNIVNYYYKSPSVVININNLMLLTKGKTAKIETVRNANGSESSDVGFSLENYKNINFNINPREEYTLTKEERENGVIIYNIDLK